jgi:hypothetical protein
LLESVGQEVPSDQLAKTVFYLIKEVGLSHQEIFGSFEYVTYTEKVEREGMFSDLLDYIFGKKERKHVKRIKDRGMNLKTFVAYSELFEEHQEEKERQRNKNQARNNMNQQTFR